MSSWEMQIVNINEEAESREDELIVGIDFGTTHSLIGTYDGVDIRLIKHADGGYLLPSILNIDSENRVFVGAQQESKNIQSIKRFLSKQPNEINQDSILRKLGSEHLTEVEGAMILKGNPKDYSLNGLASLIFTQLKDAAEIQIGRKINKAVISVPAHFNDLQRGAVVSSAKLAGFEVRRLIAEPTAAAYAYSLNQKQEGCFLVYDFGGGTFDVSILNMQEGVLQVVATGGDNKLGGDDIDHTISETLNIDMTQAKRLKEQLSKQDSVVYINHNISNNISRLEFENIIQPIINRTIKLTKNTLFDAKDLIIDGIILVGGSSRIPMIRRLLEAEFPSAKIYDEINQDHAVCFGAAQVAYNLSYRKNKPTGSLLIDVVPLSLGLELHGGLIEKIIDRNSPLPATEKRQFTTQIDNQNAIALNIYQGERELAKDCQLIASFELDNIPPMPAGMARVDVEFTIDNDGILAVSASEAHSGANTNITIKPSHNLSEQQIDKHLEEAFSLAASDHNNALLIETKLEAQELMKGLNEAIVKTPDIIPKSNMDELQNTINSLQKAINSDNRQTIIEAITELNRLAEPFIEEHLNFSAQACLVGKKVNDI